MQNIEFKDFLQAANIQKSTKGDYALLFKEHGKPILWLMYNLKYQRILSGNITTQNPFEIFQVHYRVLKFHNKQLKTKSNIMALKISEEIAFAEL